MPAPVGPLFGFVLGVAFAWSASGDPARERDLLGVPLILSSLFSLLVFAPACGYFLAFWPDWAWAYLIDSERLPAAAPLGLVLLDAASVPIGLVAAHRVVARRPGAALRVAMLPLGLASLWIASVYGRLSVQATYTQFHGDFGTRPVAGGVLGIGLLWMMLVLLAASAWTGLSLRRMTRRARRG